MTDTPESGQTATRWAPVSAEERGLVLRELDAIVSSPHFRGSKRYPALLKYVVDATLENRADDLKERTLGVEVFGRHPDYDTNADPVVRVSAGEVRKRIAQYYHENGIHSRLQIEMPVGCYVPEFHWLRPLADGAKGGVARALSPHKAKSGRKRQFLLRASAIVVAVSFFAAGLVAGYLYRRNPVGAAAEVNQLWEPLLQSARPVLIVVGTSHPDQMTPETERTTFVEHMTNPYHHVSVSTAIALAHLSGVLEGHGRNYEIKEAPETSLPDVRSRSLILVGAMNNVWTMRLMKPLRIHFTFENQVAGIEDVGNPQPKTWSIDFSAPYSSITTDYAMVARFHDATTEGPVLVIAGLGPYGTEAASEFVQSPEYLRKFANAMPRGWEKKSFEVVLKSDVIDSKAGPPVLLAAYSW
jgi:hypothetical protein